jgi:hypothetical protein
VIDPETVQFLDVNERACLDLSYSREEPLSVRVCDIAPNVTSHDAGMRKHLEKSGSMVVEGVRQRKDGSRLFVRISDASYLIDKLAARDIARQKTTVR